MNTAVLEPSIRAAINQGDTAALLPYIRDEGGDPRDLPATLLEAVIAHGNLTARWRVGLIGNASILVALSGNPYRRTLITRVVQGVDAWTVDMIPALQAWSRWMALHAMPKTCHPAERAFLFQGKVKPIDLIRLSKVARTAAWTVTGSEFGAVFNALEVLKLARPNPEKAVAILVRLLAETQEGKQEWVWDTNFRDA